MIIGMPKLTKLFVFLPKPAKPGPKCKISAAPLLRYVVSTTVEYTCSKMQLATQYLVRVQFSHGEYSTI
jgi:hypothetical protein